MRKAGVLVIFAALCVSAHGGDVANFVELGFSPDGKIFAFGQYGTDEKTLSSYGDLFFVDVAKNDFIPGANVSSPPGATPGVESAVVFSRLKEKAALSMKRLAVDGEECEPPARLGRAIYAESAAAPPQNDGLSMSFRDFHTGRSYDIALRQKRSGSKENVSSSFYISAKITSADGKEETFTVGNPGYARSGVLGYRISRIITDDENRALVFVVEKEMYFPGGNSIRYMVETLYL